MYLAGQFWSHLDHKNFSLGGKKVNKQTSKGIIISFPPKIKNFTLLYEQSQKECIYFYFSKKNLFRLSSNSMEKN